MNQSVGQTIEEVFRRSSRHVFGSLVRPLRLGRIKPADQFHGERSSKVIDPFGHVWYLGSKIEEVSHEEMQRRFVAMYENS